MTDSELQKRILKKCCTPSMLRCMDAARLFLPSALAGCVYEVFSDNLPVKLANLGAVTAAYASIPSYAVFALLTIAILPEDVFPRKKLLDIACLFASFPLSDFLVKKIGLSNYFTCASTITHVVMPLLPAGIGAASALSGNLTSSFIKKAAEPISACYGYFFSPAKTNGLNIQSHTDAQSVPKQQFSASKTPMVSHTF